VSPGQVGLWEEKCWACVVGPTLPEGEEDDGLDGDELEDRLKWTQQIHGGKVEKEESVKCQADGEVVDDGDVEVAALDAAGRERASCCPGLQEAKRVQPEARKEEMVAGEKCVALPGGEPRPERGEGGAGRKGEQGATLSFSSVGGTSCIMAHRSFVPFLFGGSESLFPGALGSVEQLPGGEGAGRTPCPL